MEKRSTVPWKRGNGAMGWKVWCSRLAEDVCGRMCLQDGAAEVLTEDVDGMLLALGVEGWYTVEGIRNAEFLVLVGAHGVIGEQFDAFHIIIYMEMLGERGEAVVAVGIARHEHMAYPRGFVNAVQIVEEGLVVGAGVTRIVLVQSVVEGLDVKQDEVGVLQHLAGFLVEDDAAGVEGGVNAGLLAETEEVEEKVCLHEGFAA